MVMTIPHESSGIFDIAKILSGSERQRLKTIIDQTQKNLIVLENDTGLVTGIAE
jgi:hypothetical protein